MAFGEPEVSESFDLAVDVVGDLAGDAVARHPRIELLPQRFDAFDPAFGAHGAPQQVGVFARASADRHRHLHQLLLKHRYPERALERFFELRMQVGDLFFAELAPDERMHGTALDGPWPHHRDLHHQVVELTRLQPRQ